MTGDFEDAFRRMLRTVVREVADEIDRERTLHAPTTPSRPPDQESRLLLRPREAAKRLAVSERHLHKLTVEGVLPCVRVGRLVRYSVETIEEWIRGAESTTHAKPISKRVTIEANDKPVKSINPSKPRETTPSKQRTVNTSPPITKQRQPKASASNRRQDTPKSAEERPNPFRLLLKEIGLDRDSFGTLTNGELMRIAKVDVPTFHGWMYLGRDMPAEALENLRKHFLIIASKKN